jgi:hypothetical protein
MRDSPALSGMLAGIDGRGAGGAAQGTGLGEHLQPSRSISFGREGVMAAGVCGQDARTLKR